MVTPMMPGLVISLRQRPVHNIEHCQKSCAEKHAIWSQQGAFQGKSHKAAVGKNGGEAVHALTLGLLVMQRPAGEKITDEGRDDGK